jgi:hypothetical protein
MATGHDSSSAAIPTERLELMVVSAVVVVLAVLALVDAVVDFVPQEVLTSGIFVALLAVLRMCTRMYAVDARTKALVESTERLEHRSTRLDATLADVAGAITGPHVTTYPNAHAFYADMGAALRGAEMRLDLTHIRAETPKDFGAAADGWFDEVREWLAVHPARSARRVISSTSPDVVAWAEQTQRELHGLNFYIEVIPWPLSIPAVNIAIIDEKRVFIALPGATPQSSPGLASEDPLTVGHFLESFNAMWNEGVLLDTWLARESPA